MRKTKPKKTGTKKRKKYFLQLTGKGFFLGLCLLFLISGWMFVLGVLVGRGTAPVNFDIEALQKELLALKETMIRQEKKAMERDSEKSGANAALEFYEALKKKEKDEQTKLPENIIPPKTPPKAPLASQKRVSQSKETQIEVQSAKQAKASPKGIFAIQVASTKDAASADELVKKLNQSGFPSFSAVAKIPNKGTWYRVRVGPYENRDQADQVLRELQNERYKGILVKN